MAEHGGGVLLSLEIPDAGPGDSDYFVEPRAAGEFFIGIQFSQPLLTSDFRGATILVSQNEGGVASFSNPRPVSINEETGTVYIRAGGPSQPASLAIRIYDSTGVLISERRFSVVPGDINGDGTVDASDDPSALNGTSASESELAIRADVDVDGTVSGGSDGAIVSSNSGDTHPGDPPDLDNPPATYRVTYDPNAADSGTVPVDGSNYLDGANVTVLTNSGGLSRAGYTFVGWNTQADGLGTNYPIGAHLVIGTADVTLYAQWSLLPTYTITYDANLADSGTVPVDPNNYLDAATATVLTNSGGLSRAGYSFDGWNTQSDGLGVSYAAGSSLTISGADVTLYAKWTPLPTYTVAYDPNSADSGTAPLDANSYLDGANVTVLTNSGGLSRAGYSFDGWNTQSDGLGTNYAEGSSLTISGADVTLYAKWALLPTHQIFYFENGATGTAPADAGFYYNNQPITIQNQGALSLSGHVFSGWNTAADGSGVSYAPGAALMTATDLELHAQWQLNVSGGGSGTSMDPYVLLDAADLDMLRYDLDSHYRVDANIDLGVPPFDTTPGWVPIGTSAEPFTGTFDGGYAAAVISNLFIDTAAADADGTGLFGTVQGAIIRNVALESVDIQTPLGRRVGALVGVANGSTVVEDSYVRGTLTVDTWSGGMIGNMQGTSVLRRSFADVAITGNDYTGGLVGQLKNGGATVEDSYAIGSINAGGTSAALIGQVNSVDFVYRSYAAMVLAGGADPFLAYNTGTAVDNFFDVTVSSTGTPRGATALVTTDMLTQSMYTGWDFSLVGPWDMQAGTYPFHRWYTGVKPVP